MLRMVTLATAAPHRHRQAGKSPKCKSITKEGPSAKVQFVIPRVRTEMGHPLHFLLAYASGNSAFTFDITK